LEFAKNPMLYAYKMFKNRIFVGVFLWNLQKTFVLLLQNVQKMKLRGNYRDVDKCYIV